MRLIGFVASILPPSVVIPDGSLLFLQHSNRHVERFTDSETTHVAIVIDGWVYEATPPEVRRIKLEEYESELSLDQEKNKKLKVRLLLPKDDYAGNEVNQMRNYLDSKIGKPYTIWGYILGKPVGDGYHCSQLVSGSLNTTRKFVFENPPKVTPGGLEQIAIKKYQGYWLIR